MHGGLATNKHISIHTHICAHVHFQLYIYIYTYILGLHRDYVGALGEMEKKLNIFLL